MLSGKVTHIYILLSYIGCLSESDMERILDLFAPLNSKLNGLKRQAWDHRLSMFGHYLNVTASASGTLLMATTSSILLFLLPQL